MTAPQFNPIVSADLLPKDNYNWLIEKGFGPDAAAAADILFFNRFGDELSAIVLIPERFAAAANLPPTTCATKHRLKFGAANEPARELKAKRTERKRTCSVIQIDDNTKEVTLRQPPARLSVWGIDLQRATWRPDINAQLNTSMSGLNEFIKLNKLDPIVDPTAADFMHAAFLASATARQLRLPCPRLPLIHNQRCGQHFFLFLDNKRYGSPSDIQIIVHSGLKPRLFGWPFVERHTAASRKNKSNLLLTSTWDKSLRFYQLTPEQWNTWDHTPPDINSYPFEVRTHIDHAIVVAHSLRQFRTH